MKRKKIGYCISTIFYLLLALWLVNSESPEKFFAAFIVFLAAVQSLFRTFESDYCRRLSNRLERVILFLSLFFLIKIWLSI